MLLIKLLLATAARINEILQFQESDIDYANGVVHLRMVLQMQGDALLCL